MFDPNEKELQTLNTGRLMQASADVLLPLLESQTRSAIGKIIQAYRAGKPESLLALAAELATLDSMKSQITRQIAAAQQLERKILDGNGTE